MYHYFTSVSLITKYQIIPSFQNFTRIDIVKLKQRFSLIRFFNDIVAQSNLTFCKTNILSMSIFKVLHILLQFPKPESRIANVQTGITKPKLIILFYQQKMEIA